jgi:tRNA(adenine34) deaminase
LGTPRQESVMTPMSQALIEAGNAAARGEVPVGAVVTDADGVVLAAFGNEVEARQDATAHAEMLALRAAALRIGGKFLPGCTLTVTLEPCPLCAAAISLCRIERLVFGAYDPKSGGVEHGPRVFEQSTCHHRPDVVGGVAERESAALLTAFFEGRRSPAHSAGR